MKKILIILATIIMIFILNKDLDEGIVLIPNNSIRVRVIANSNSISDQYEKNKIKEEIQIYLEDLLKDAKTKKETETLLKNNINNIDKIVEDSLKEMNNETIYNINYGKNFFPKKEYKGVSYESGFYESLVITLGEGKGKNWWCVLFPPLCLVEEQDNLTNEDYKLYITELLEKYN